ncbi:hypothetical protein CSHISOI_10981 [Colletotrichum shisoi]|uniref:Uncharacterized protein n=1 Tax=Colletotrichum shisoi TaxID=2078593 RepID=A0A5Q4BCI4_9PEZI|nr:hypothetical protein CSHISOI_10981 [Colletotrichum shisoi]
MPPKVSKGKSNPPRPVKRKLPPGSSKPLKKKPKIEPPRPKPFLFLSLPPEIRNLIYGFAFIRPDGVRLEGQITLPMPRCPKWLWKLKFVRHARGRSRRASAEDGLPVPFLRCCRRVHAEARAMLYSNCFVAEDMETLGAWLDKLGSGNATCLQRIRVRTEPQTWSPRVSTKVLEQQERYRNACRRVANMLAAAVNLESFRTIFYYHHKIKLPRRSRLRRAGRVSGWVGLARKITEVLYHDFRPIYSKGLTRGRTPGELCRVLEVSPNNWWGRRQSLSPSTLTARDAERAENEVAKHMRLLLERNLRYRLHPRFRAQDSSS